MDLSDLWFASLDDFLLNLLTMWHPKPADFTPGQRMPTSVVLKYKEGVYAIDSAGNGRVDPEKNVLTWLVRRTFGLEGAVRLKRFTGHVAREVPDGTSRGVSPVAT